MASVTSGPARCDVTNVFILRRPAAVAEGREQGGIEFNEPNCAKQWPTAAFFTTTTTTQTSARTLARQFDWKQIFSRLIEDV